MKILVVDDEKTLVKGIKFNLENEGYEVDFCYDGAAAVEMARNTEYALLLLDMMMPGLAGLSACQQIRMFSTVPIIMLTAKSEDSDKLLGFESGADDYLTKPFNILELKARVRALIRRSTLTAAQTAPENRNRLTKGHIVLDTAKREALKDNVPVDLTVKEYDLMELFMKKPGQVFSREQLLDLVWGYDYQGDIRTVDVHIRRLREKLEQNPAAPEYILTKWGVGYYFVD
ncbi:MAG: response regulator transcription factor [Oscillospiraceae bacterium]|nr:response regulator transcription factor [Oscillospiraceae bacterium]